MTTTSPLTTFPPRIPSHVQIQDAEEELSASATLEHGAISISATETALNIYLAEKLRAFHTD